MEASTFLDEIENVWYSVTNDAADPKSIRFVYYALISENTRKKMSIEKRAVPIFTFNVERGKLDDLTMINYYRENPIEFIKKVTSFKNEHGDIIVPK